MKTHLKCLLFAFLCLSFGCKKETLSSEAVMEIYTGRDVQLKKIHFSSPQIGYVVGGTMFEEGAIFKTTDGGNSWDAMPIVDDPQKIIFNIQQYGDKIYATGLDGKTYINYPHRQEVWFYYQNIWWERIYDLHFFSKNEGIGISGQNWYNGRLYRIDSLGNVLERDTFEFELNDLLEIPNRHLLVCGYGAIKWSTDEGRTWGHTNASGDHFKKMHAIGNTVWCIGRYGTLVKSYDGGLNWEKLRNGNVPTRRQIFLNGLYFRNAQEGMLVGDKGLVRYTTDGGKNWKELKKFTELHLNDVYLTNEYAFIVADGGRIYKIDANFF